MIRVPILLVLFGVQILLLAYAPVWACIYAPFFLLVFLFLNSKKNW